MKIVPPSIEILGEIHETEILKRLEFIGRRCYKSENKITENSCKEFVAKIIKNGHHAIIEHVTISVNVVCDRGVSHEIVRHRIASYAQESTRYCNYSNDKFGNEIAVIEPAFFSDIQSDTDRAAWNAWSRAMLTLESCYMELIKLGRSPQEARSVLPNSLKTEIVMTMNLREWRHFLTLRTSSAAHPQMREVAGMILGKFKQELPIVFGDIA